MRAGLSTEIVDRGSLKILSLGSMQINLRLVHSYCSLSLGPKSIIFGHRATKLH